MEIFRWERAKFIYDEAVKDGKEPTKEVYYWLVSECKSSHDEAMNIATSPILKK